MQIEATARKKEPTDKQKGEGVSKSWLDQQSRH